jgi:hypothetical protein
LRDGFGHIEREAPEYGEIERSMIGAGSGVVLIEGHIKHPMQLVLDAPMRAYDDEGLRSGQRLRQDIEAAARCGDSDRFASDSLSSRLGERRLKERPLAFSPRLRLCGGRPFVTNDHPRRRQKPRFGIDTIGGAAASE